MNVKDWMKDNAENYEEAFELANDATSVFGAWDTEACPGSLSIPAYILEEAEKLIDNQL